MINLILKTELKECSVVLIRQEFKTLLISGGISKFLKTRNKFYWLESMPFIAVIMKDTLIV